MHLFPLIIFGILAGCFALLLELVFLNVPVLTSASVVSFFDFDSIFSFQAIGTLLLIALIEEASKYIFLLQYIQFSIKRKIPLPSFVSVAVLFGAGFSTLEFLFAFQSEIPFPPLSLLKTLFLHTATTLLLTSFLSSPDPDHENDFSRESDPSPKKRHFALSPRNLLVLSGAVLIHLAYNIFLLTL